MGFVEQRTQEKSARISLTFLRDRGFVVRSSGAARRAIVRNACEDSTHASYTPIYA